MASSSGSPSSTSEVTGRRGIPAAQFVEDVQKYLTQSGLDVNPALGFFQERLQQYKLVEMKLLVNKGSSGLAKLPDIEKCSDAVASLQAKGTSEALLLILKSQKG